MIERYYTRATVAERLACSVQTVDAGIRAGTQTGGRDGLFPVVRIGGAVRIPESSVARWLEKCELRVIGGESGGRRLRRGLSVAKNGGVGM